MFLISLYSNRSIVLAGVESFLVLPTDAPTVVVDRLEHVRGMANDRQVDLGDLRSTG